MESKVQLDFGPTGFVKEQDLRTCSFVGCDELILKNEKGCYLHQGALIEQETLRRNEHPRRQVYDNPLWKICRRFVYRRDNWTCVSCGHHDYMNRMKSLSCDHINEGGVMQCPDPFDPGYCAVKCNVCSGKKDGQRGGSRSS